MDQGGSEVEPAARVIVSGATGLVGRALVEVARARGDVREVVALTRRATEAADDGVRALQVDYEALCGGEVTLPPARAIFVALGTTLRRAGSREAMRRVDLDYAVGVARAARRAGVGRLGLVSSVGASPRAGSWYLRLKGEIEEELSALGFERSVAVRPSILLGARDHSRPLERVGQGAARVLGPLLRGGLARYRGISAREVADGLVRAALDGDEDGWRAASVAPMRALEWSGSERAAAR